jgi:hypothetical protein
MEPEGSLQCSQKHITGLCPEPDESTPYHHPISIRPILILSTHLHVGLPSRLFPSDFHTKQLYTLNFSLMCTTFLVHLIVLYSHVTFSVNTNLQ